MRLIDLYYQSYKNFTKGIEKPVNKGIPHDSGLSMSRLLYRKGKLFGVFWAAFLGLSVLLIVYTGAVMFIDVSNDVESKYYTLFYIILLLAILVDVVILDALDKSHVKRKYTALYEESIKRAVRFKENLEKEFRAI